MFLNEMSRPQQDAFFELAWRLMSVDGIHEAELAVIRSLRAQLSLSQEWAADVTVPLPSLLGALGERRARRAALLELLGIAYSDGDYSAGEQDFLADVADTFDLSALWVERAERWVQAQIALSHDATALIEED